MNDFYILAGTVLPILVLSNNVGAFVMPLGRRVDPAALERKELNQLVGAFDRSSVQMKWLRLGRDLVYAVFFVLAEVVCLTYLFHGRLTFGAPWIVWVALAMWGIQVAGSMVLEGSKETLEPLVGDFLTNRLRGIQTANAERARKAEQNRESPMGD